MDEVAEAIGALRAGVENLARNIEELRLVRQQQHAENVARMADIQAQIHEIKHIQNNDAMKAMGVAAQLVAHQETDTVAHATIMGKLDESHNKLDELTHWRNRIYGAMFILIFFLTVFGHEVWDAGSRLFHSKP